MSEPQTLLAMAGVAARPHALAESAVVMIDAQREYVDGRLPLVGIQAALAAGAELLAAARRAGRPVVHVRHKGKAGGLFDPESESFAIATQAAPADGEAVVDKTAPNAFAGTDLDSVLEGLGVKTVIVAGFMTHMCVSSTVRAALDLGYGCTVLGPACATRDLPDGQGGVVPAAELHRAEVAALADRFAMIATDVAELGG
jgi:nicotinamidase-related amidase